MPVGLRVAVEATSAAPGGGLSFLRGAVGAMAASEDVRLDVFVRPEFAGCHLGPGTRTIGARWCRSSVVHRLVWVQCAFPAIARDYDAVFAPGNLVSLPLASRSVLYVQNAHVLPQREWRDEYGRLKRRLQRFMARLSLLRAGRALFVTEALKEMGRPYWEGSPLEPGVARPGVTMPLVEAPVRRAGRDVLLVGNLMPHKRMDRAVRAFGRLVAEHPEYTGRLRIAGQEMSPGLLESLREIARRFDVLDRVDFMGFVEPEQLRRAYVEGGCYLSTSALESLALPALEAMALGVPVVVPDNPVFREVCGGVGLYFDNDAAISRRLWQALNDLPSPAVLRRAARDLRKRFCWTAFAERVVADLRAVACT